MSASARRLALAATLLSLTWPIFLAHRMLGVIFTRPYVADEAAALAIPCTALFAVIAGVLASRSRAQEPIAWIVRSALWGAVASAVWFAFAGYIDSRRSATAFFMTLLGGGLLYGVPFGLVAGSGLGAEVAALQRWSSRRTDNLATLTSIALTVFLNVALGAAVWAAFE